MIVIATWPLSHTSNSEDRPLFQSSLFRRQMVYGGEEGILYLMRARVKHETGRWRVTGQRCVAARKLGISMTRARLRRADLIVFFFFFFVSRPSRKSRTKIRPGTDRELNVRFSDACRCANKRWSPVVPREAEAAVLHVVEFELITTISRGPSKLWGGRGGGRGASCAGL